MYHFINILFYFIILEYYTIIIVKSLFKPALIAVIIYH